MINNHPTEAHRVVSLPLVDYYGCDLTDELRRPGAPRVWVDGNGNTIKGLLPTQSAILAAVRDAQGGFFPVGCGEGKAGAGLLSPTVLGSKRAVGLTPAGTLDQLRGTHASWGRHFRILPAEVFHLTSYARVSREHEEEGALSFLERVFGFEMRDGVAVPPEGVRESDMALVLDEAHRLANKTASRTQKVLRFIAAHPDVRVVAMSGTMLTTVGKCAHLAEIALRDQSPLPRDKTHTRAWGNCIDEDGRPSRSDWARFEKLWQWGYGDEDRSSKYVGQERKDFAGYAFRERLHWAPGTVVSTRITVPNSLRIIGIDDVDVPAEVEAAVERVITTKTDPAGNPLENDLMVWGALRLVSAGFYYEPLWPAGCTACRYAVPGDGAWLENPERVAAFERRRCLVRPQGHKAGRIIDRAWVDAKRAWGRAVRTELDPEWGNPRQGYDSPKTVERAVLRQLRREYGIDTSARPLLPQVAGARAPRLAQRLAAWLDQGEKRWGGKREPPRRTVWLSTYLVDHAIRWARKQREPVVIWYEHQAYQEALEERLGAPVYSQGNAPDVHAPAHLCAMQVTSQGEGLDLAQWGVSLYLEVPSSAVAWEQTLARFHRAGQKRDEVLAYVYQHTESAVSALRKARRKAHNWEAKSGNEQRLNLADFCGAIEPL